MTGIALAGMYDRFVYVTVRRDGVLILDVIGTFCHRLLGTGDLIL